MCPTSGASSIKRSRAMGVRRSGPRFLRGERTRQGEGEGRALARLGLDPELAAVGLDHLLADGQARPGPLVLVPAVQAAEDAEDLLVVTRVDAHAVVPHEQRLVGPGLPVR